jgi:hypothetical protein
VDELDSDDLDGGSSALSSAGEDDEDDLASGSVTPSLPLKRREIAPDKAVASKKAPSPRKAKGKAAQTVKVSPQFDFRELVLRSPPGSACPHQ